MDITDTPEPSLRERLIADIEAMGNDAPFSFKQLWGDLTKDPSPAPGPAPDVMVDAVLDVIAPYADPLPGYSKVRVPVFLVDWGGVPVVPSVEGVRAMAEQVVTAIRTASGPSPLETAARYFADIWGEFAPDLPDIYGCTLNCTEADALADLFTACGRQDRADAVLAAHAARDQEGDRHYQAPAVPS